MTEKGKKRIVCVFLTLIICGILFWIEVEHGLHTDAYYDWEKNDEVADYTTMRCDGIVDQHFIAESYLMKGINVIIVGLSEKPMGEFLIQILDNQNKILFENKISYLEVENGEWNNFITKIGVNKGEEYIFRFQNLDNMETPYFLLGGEGATSSYNTALYHDEVEQTGNIICGYGFYPEVTKLEKLLWLFIGLTLMIRIWDLFIFDRKFENVLFGWIPERKKCIELVKYPVRVGTILGTITFILVYGVQVLNPCYTDWLLTGGDLSQHYLGWEFFRKADWCWQFGLMNNITYPNEVSVIFTDSVPLFAVVFKLLRGILPDSFQYFGWWGIMCMILQGILASKILSLYIKDNIELIIGTIFILLTPTLLNRMFYHTALAAQWIILLGIYLVLDYKRFIESKKGLLVIGIIAFSISTIHLYFLPMGGLLIFAYALLHFMYEKNIKLFVIEIGMYIIIALFFIWSLGGFGSWGSYDSIGLGRFGFNLNAFVNPMGYSSLIADKGRTIFSQREGFAYLGLGMIILVGWMLINVINRIITKEKSLMEKNVFWVTFVMCILFLIIAMSQKITFGDHTLLILNPPRFIEWLWSIFRATGRFIWPVIYLIEIMAICADRDVITKQAKVSLLCVCLIIQVIDLHNVLWEKHQLFTAKQTYENFLDDEEWTNLLQDRSYRHIYFMSYDLIYDEEKLYAFADYATNHDMTLNNFYLAREVDENVDIVLEQKIKNPGDEDLFISEVEAFEPQEYPTLQWQQIGDYFVGTK